MSKLFLVPTPIGNLEDITFRSIRILNEVDLILAEDTRTSGKLLKHFDIKPPMQSFHMHNEHKVLDKMINKLKVLLSLPSSSICLSLLSLRQRTEQKRSAIKSAGGVAHVLFFGLVDLNDQELILASTSEK